jgi:hypothetical protein
LSIESNKVLNPYFLAPAYWLCSQVQTIQFKQSSTSSIG